MRTVDRATFLTLKEFVDKALTPSILARYGMADTPESRDKLGLMAEAAMEAGRVVHITKAEAADFLTVIAAIREADDRYDFLNGWDLDTLSDLEAKLK